MGDITTTSLAISCTVIVVICSITLVVHYHVNHYKRMDRFYYENNKWLYILSQLCYYIVFVAFVLNARYLVYITIEWLALKQFGITIDLTGLAKSS